MKFQWEVIDRNSPGTARAKIIGGWLVRTWDVDYDSSSQSQGLIFVPDPEHKWSIK